MKGHEVAARKLAQCHGVFVWIIFMWLNSSFFKNLNILKIDTIKVSNKMVIYIYTHTKTYLMLIFYYQQCNNNNQIKTT